MAADEPADALGVRYTQPKRPRPTAMVPPVPSPPPVPSEQPMHHMGYQPNMPQQRPPNVMQQPEHIQQYPDQERISNSDELDANKSITQYLEVISCKEKDTRVKQILLSERDSKILIFCSTEKLCDQIARGIGAAPFHGDKFQNERNRVLNEFCSGKSGILVATDVAAQGLDVKDIRVVINYNFPKSVQAYVRRVGLTRSKGVAYTFFSEEDEKLATDLIILLEKANQPVPDKLREVATNGWIGFGRDRSGMSRFDSGGVGGRWDSGGRGMRNGLDGEVAPHKQTHGRIQIGQKHDVEVLLSVHGEVAPHLQRHGRVQIGLKRDLEGLQHVHGEVAPHMQRHGRVQIIQKRDIEVVRNIHGEVPPHLQRHGRVQIGHKCDFDVQKSVDISVQIMKNLKILSKPLERSTLPRHVIEVQPKGAMDISLEIAKMCNEAVNNLRGNQQIQFQLPLVEHEFNQDLGYYVSYQKGVSKSVNTLESGNRSWVYSVLLECFLNRLNGPASLSRSIYYQFPDVFWQSDIVYDAMDRLCQKFNCTRASLNIYSSSKGKVCGDLAFCTKRNRHIDCRTPKCIPDELELLTLQFLTSSVKFVLVIEKETIFDKITSSNFCHDNECVAVTGKGEPDISTRLFVHLLRTEQKLPVFVLVDCNPYGVKIVSVYKHGSKKKGYDNHRLVVEDAYWVGLHPNDIIKHKHDLQNASSQFTKADFKLCQDLLDDAAIRSNSKWVEQVKAMEGSGQKYELEALDPDFLTEKYLPSKLSSMNWL